VPSPFRRGSGGRGADKACIFLPISKKESFRFARSIGVNHFDSLLNLIRFRYETMWVFLTHTRLIFRVFPKTTDSARRLLSST
jgi:hypothetical protein